MQGSKKLNLLTLKPNQKVVYYKNLKKLPKVFQEMKALCNSNRTSCEICKITGCSKPKVNSDLAITWKNNRLYLKMNPLKACL
jgi:hypothetical protein